MPMSMPTIRETTTNAVATPCTSSSVKASRAALTGASARPKPRPPTTSATLATGSSSVVRPQRVISTKPVAAISMPMAVTTPGDRKRIR